MRPGALGNLSLVGLLPDARVEFSPNVRRGLGLQRYVRKSRVQAESFNNRSKLRTEFGWFTR